MARKFVYAKISTNKVITAVRAATHHSIILTTTRALRICTVSLYSHVFFEESTISRLDSESGGVILWNVRRRIILANHRVGSTSSLLHIHAGPLQQLPQPLCVRTDTPVRQETGDEIVTSGRNCNITKATAGGCLWGEGWDTDVTVYCGKVHVLETYFYQLFCVREFQKFLSNPGCHLLKV